MDNLITESNNNQITSQSLHAFNSLLNIEISKSANVETRNSELELEVQNYKAQLIKSKQENSQIIENNKELQTKIKLYENEREVFNSKLENYFDISTKEENLLLREKLNIQEDSLCKLYLDLSLHQILIDSLQNEKSQLESKIKLLINQELINESEVINIKNEFKRKEKSLNEEIFNIKYKLEFFELNRKEAEQKYKFDFDLVSIKNESLLAEKSMLQIDNQNLIKLNEEIKRSLHDKNKEISAFEEIISLLNNKSALYKPSDYNTSDISITEKYILKENQQAEIISNLQKENSFLKEKNSSLEDSYSKLNDYIEVLRKSNKNLLFNLNMAQSQIFPSKNVFIKNHVNHLNNTRDNYVYLNIEDLELKYNILLIEKIKNDKEVTTNLKCQEELIKYQEKIKELKLLNTELTKKLEEKAIINDKRDNSSDSNYLITSANRSEIEFYKQKNNELENIIKDETLKLLDKEKSIFDLNNTILNLQSDIQIARAEINSLEEKFNEVNEENKRLNNEKTSIFEKIEVIKEKLVEKINSFKEDLRLEINTYLKEQREINTIIDSIQHNLNSFKLVIPQSESIETTQVFDKNLDSLLILKDLQIENIKLNKKANALKSQIEIILINNKPNYRETKQIDIVPTNDTLLLNKKRHLNNNTNETELNLKRENELLQIQLAEKQNDINLILQNEHKENNKLTVSLKRSTELYEDIYSKILEIQRKNSQLELKETEILDLKEKLTSNNLEKSKELIRIENLVSALNQNKIEISQLKLKITSLQEQNINLSKEDMNKLQVKIKELEEENKKIIKLAFSQLTKAKTIIDRLNSNDIDNNSLQNEKINKLNNELTEMKRLYTEIGTNDNSHNSVQATPSRIIFDTLKKGMLDAIEIIKHLQAKLLENNIKEKTKEENNSLLSQNKALLEILNFLSLNYSSNDLIKGDIKKLRENINQLSK